MDTYTEGMSRLETFSGMSMNVILYSKDSILLEHWKSTLAISHSDLKLCSNYMLLLEHIQKNRCLVLFHLSVPYHEAYEYHRLMSQSLLPERLFVLASCPDIDESVSILHSGAHGYANANLHAGKLKVAVEFILNGDIWVDKEILHKLLARNSKDFQQIETVPDQQEILSKREMQIVDKVLEGKTNAQTADELDISERTVKTHISNIYRKTNTKNRIDLMNKFQSY